MTPSRLRRVAFSCFALSFFAALKPASSAPAALPEILTPPAPATPRINGPGVFGVRPGSPFFYAIPATGQRPMTFAVAGLPAGLVLDPATGRITGRLAQAGEYAVTLRARNALGAAERKFRIIAGDRIALTPPMGWSSWNCWGGAVSQEKVLSSARALVGKGLAQHGWSFINIDDGWQATRGGKGHAIQPNSKFPDMKALADEVHGLGLKFGIYSTPWRGTYEGQVGGSSDHADGAYDWVKSGDHNEFYRFGKDPKTQGQVKMKNWVFGKYSFAKSDVAQWAAWGADYLKYDWYPNDIAHVAEMSAALRDSGRDIVYSLSNTAIYDDAAEYARLSNLWRTTGDIRDTWESVCRNGFLLDRWAAYSGPGHWNDPDMLVVGMVGGWDGHLHPTRLTPDEQYAHISLWCLLAAPLIIGCDIAQIDDFTLGLLTNDEVLAIDQDALGKQATQVSNEKDKVVYAKTLEDGSMAVGLFNRGESETKIAVTWGPWGILATPRQNEKRTVRDLWRQKDLGTFAGKFEATVAPHGVVLVKIGPAQ